MGARGWGTATPPPPSPTPMPGWRGRGAGTCLPLASWVQAPLGGDAQSPNADKAPSWGTTRVSPQWDRGEQLLLLTSPSRSTCQMLRMWKLCPVCVT